LKINKVFFIVIVGFILNLSLVANLLAHHVLGRPAYSLNEDSNTPPSMQIEIQIGEFYVTYMVYPAFPKPEEHGRVNLYASRIDNGDTYEGEITFKVREDLSVVEQWFYDLEEEVLGVQTVYDGVYRQGFLFREPGDYIITAQFEYNNEPYVIDFPLQVGETTTMMPIGISVAIIIFTLLGVNIFQRRRLVQAKIRTAREDVLDKNEKI